VPIPPPLLGYLPPCKPGCCYCRCRLLADVFDPVVRNLSRQCCRSIRPMANMLGGGAVRPRYCPRKRSLREAFTVRWIDKRYGRHPSKSRSTFEALKLLKCRSVAFYCPSLQTCIINRCPRSSRFSILTVVIIRRSNYKPKDAYLISRNMNHCHRETLNCLCGRIIF
jgi:hypothetical protein